MGVVRTGIAVTEIDFFSRYRQGPGSDARRWLNAQQCRRRRVQMKTGRGTENG